MRRKRKKNIYAVQVHDNWKRTEKEKEKHRYCTNLYGNKMDKLIILENEKKPKRFPVIRSQKRRRRKKRKKKICFCEVNHRETTADNS